MSGGLTSTVGAALGIGLAGDAAGRDRLSEVAGLALRDNPRRAHLIVSRTLGKHVPAPPTVVRGCGHDLADRVREALPGQAVPRETLVVGYCETATGLGHAVAERLEADYLHTTRRPTADLPVTVSFEEEHSHAVAHHLQPGPSVTLAGAGPLVLVDDELTTGRTALNTIEAWHALFPRPRYVIATLLDTRTTDVVAAFDERAAALGVEVSVVSLTRLALTIPADVLERAMHVRAQLPPPAGPPAGRSPGTVAIHDGWWPTDMPCTARNGMTPAETAALDATAGRVAARLAPELSTDGRVLVLGTEELMHLPVLVGDHLARSRADLVVRCQSTTRSPVHAANDPGYAIRRTISFPAPDDGARPSRLHNIVDPAEVPAGDAAWEDQCPDAIVVVVDAPAPACEGLVEALRPYAGAVHVVLVGTEAGAP